MDGTWKHVKKFRPMSMLHKKNQQVYKKRYSWAYTWTWLHYVALLESVAAALPKALGHWSFEKRKKMDGWMFAWDDWKSWFSNVFLNLEEQNRFTAQAERKFWHLSHTPANRNKCPYCKHFLTNPTNTSILSLSLKNHHFNSSPLQGRRVNRLPCFWRQTKNTVKHKKKSKPVVFFCLGG